MARSTETVRIHVEGLRPRTPGSGDLPALDSPRSTRRPRARSTACTAEGSRPRSWPASSAGRGRASTASSTRCGPCGILERQARIHAARELRRPRGRRDDPRPDARAGRRQGAAADEGPQGAAPLPGEPLRGPAPGPRAGDAPVPQDELPEVPGQPAPRAGRPGPRQDRRTSTRSSASRKRRWRSRTRSSAPTCAWSSRSPSGTSARRTTSSSWSATATCR